MTFDTVMIVYCTTCTVLGQGYVKKLRHTLDLVEVKSSNWVLSGE